MLYLNDLIKNYGKFRAVDRLSLHVPKGDLFGFVGPNGAGKTTTIRMLCGLLKPDYGSIFIAGYELRRQSEAVRRCIGYVPDFFGVYDNLKVKEYMEFYGSIYGIDDSEIHRMTGDLLELVNLSGSEEAYVDGLSRGMKQRLCVARALLHNPELLVMDEPSSGLDPRARVEMKELLLNLHSLGKTVIISSHILSDISEMCSSIGIMNRGRLVTAGTMEDILGMGRNEHHLIIGIRGDMEKAVNHLKEMPDVNIVSIRENEVVVNCDGRDEEINRVVGQLMAQGVLVSGFRREESNLEALFIQLTTGQNMGMPMMSGGPMMQGMPGMQNAPMPQGMPVMQNAPMPQQMPMMQNAPMTQGMPMMQNAPAPQGKSMMQNAPAPQGTPAMQNSPMPREMPVMQNAPAPQDMPMMQNVSAPQEMPLTAATEQNAAPSFMQDTPVQEPALTEAVSAPVFETQAITPNGDTGNGGNGNE
ncbi:MAG: ATP-binding cassette domain-containing protein [Lachnospiraceae bacterium]|nr:ATP-binding cassette domain-containing protein [Lachnospiraceae bacterium]